MTAAATIARAVSAGIAVKVEGGRLVLRASQRPDDRLLEDLRREGPAIVAYLQGFAAWTDDDWNALYEERAAVVEFDGRLARRDAEAKAEEEMNLVRVLVRSSDG